jgi:uncharacterized membrane protein
MTILLPAALLSILPVLLIAHRTQSRTFYMAMAGLALFLIAFIVTLVVEAPISRQLAKWTISTAPNNWQELRDRWGKFHIVRVTASLLGLALLVSGAIF